MMKKTIRLFIVLGFCIMLTGACASANENISYDTSDDNTVGSYEIDNQYDTNVYKMGDVNSDGSVVASDCLNMMEVLCNTENSYMAYESADLNDDLKIDLKDVLALKKKIAGISDYSNARRFNTNDIDITDKLENLGMNIPMGTRWNNASYQTIISRNPFDMIAVKDKVMVSGGNYDKNLGPVEVNTFTRNSNKKTYSGVLNTEQVNRFYMYDNNIFALAVDPQEWQSAPIYYMTQRARSWVTKNKMLPECIHCYDMAKYNGKLFFCGSADKNDSNYKNFNNSALELSKATVYVYSGKNIASAKASDFRQVEFVSKYGSVITYYTSIISSVYKDSNGEERTYYYINTVPRIYDLFEFNNSLYAFYYDCNYKYYGDDNNDYNGLYKYDEEKGQFIFDTELNSDYFIKRFDDETMQDRDKIQHDFIWNDTHYFIFNGLSATKDFKDYYDVVIPNYEEYEVNDVIFRSGKVYLLASKENNDGTFVNTVIETEDFNNYRAVLHFSAKSFARSFEFCNGAFYFGLGAYPVKTGPGYDDYSANEECGRIFRYIYYK